MKRDEQTGSFEAPGFLRNLDSRLGLFYEGLHNSDDDSDLDDSEGRYEIEDKMAQGGLKDIYRAFDRRSQRYVAMACIREDQKATFTASFIREAHLTALLEHPNIIPVYDVEEGENPFFTMKIIQGENLSSILFKDSSRFSRNQLLRSFVQICSAVSYAHSRGVVHLDLKPENIRIDKYGEVLLHDWGLSKRLFIPKDDSNLLVVDKVDSEKIIKGTPSYMAPEQFSPDKKVTDERTDIFSLGCILYSILTRQTPFNDSLEIKGRQLTEPISKDRNIPESLNAVTVKALQENPDERYQSAEELKLELERYLDGFPTKAEDAHFIKQLFLVVKRNKFICSILLLSSLILISVVSVFIGKLKSSEAQTKAAFVKAQKAQKNAELSLAQAKENFDMYFKEKEQRLELSEISSESLLKANIKTDIASYNDAMQHLKAALKVSPDNPAVYSKIVLLNIFYEKFDKALENYPKSDKRPFIAKAIEVIKNFAAHFDKKRPLSDEHFFQLIEELHKTANKWIVGNILVSRQMRTKGREEHLSFIKSTFKALNKKQADWPWDYQSNDGVIFRHLTLREDKKNYSLLGLAACKISSLDICRLKNIYLNDLSFAFINKLNVYGARLHGLQNIKRIHGLEEIIVRKGQLSEEEKAFLSFIKITELE